MFSFFWKMNQTIRYLLFVFYTGCIILLSLLPPNDFPKMSLFPGADKVVHFLMYFFFSVIGAWALKAEVISRNYFITAILMVSWGMLMEILQLNMHIGRSFSWFDMLANVVGVLVGVLTYRLFVITSKK